MQPRLGGTELAAHSGGATGFLSALQKAYILARFTIRSANAPSLISSSFLAFDILFTLLSTFKARLLVPRFF